VRPTREFCQETLGYRLYERIELDDGSEAGAWMSASIAAHELIYTRDAHGARGQFWGVKTVESFHTYGTPPV
jgi:catechol 2,3-dioxygenase